MYKIKFNTEELVTNISKQLSSDEKNVEQFNPFNHFTPLDKRDEHNVAKWVKCNKCNTEIELNIEDIISSEGEYMGVNVSAYCEKCDISDFI